MNEHITGETFTAYIDGVLTDHARDEAQFHLEACPTCAAEMGRFQEIKIRYSRLPKRPAPAALLARLRHLEAPRLGWAERARTWLVPRTLWWPASVFAGVALVSTVFFVNRPGPADFVDLDSLLVAHSKYQGESLVPHPDISQSNYSARLASFYREQD